MLGSSWQSIRSRQNKKKPQTQVDPGSSDFWRQKIKAIQDEQGTSISEAKDILEQWKNDGSKITTLVPEDDDTTSTIINHLMDKIVIDHVNLSKESSDPKPQPQASTKSDDDDKDRQMICKLRVLQRLRTQLEQAKSNRRLQRLEDQKREEQELALFKKREETLILEAKRGLARQRQQQKLASVFNMIDSSKVKFLFYQTFLGWYTLSKVKQATLKSFTTSVKMKRKISIWHYWRRCTKIRQIEREKTIKMTILIDHERKLKMAQAHHLHRLYSKILKGFKLNVKIARERKRLLREQQSSHVHVQAMSEFVEGLVVKKAVWKEIKDRSNDKGRHIDKNQRPSKPPITLVEPFAGMNERQAQRESRRQALKHLKMEKEAQQMEEKKRLELEQKLQHELNLKNEAKQRREEMRRQAQMRQEADERKRRNTEKLVKAIKLHHSQLSKIFLKKWISKYNTTLLRTKLSMAFCINAKLREIHNLWVRKLENREKQQSETFQTRRVQIWQKVCFTAWKVRLVEKKKLTTESNCHNCRRLYRWTLSHFVTSMGKRRSLAAAIQSRIHHILEEKNKIACLSKWHRYVKLEKKERWHESRRQEMRRKVSMLLQ